MCLDFENELHCCRINCLSLREHEFRVKDSDSHMPARNFSFCASHADLRVTKQLALGLLEMVEFLLKGYKIVLLN